MPKSKLFAALIASLCLAAAQPAQTAQPRPAAPLPRLQKNGVATQMMVDGKPFIMLAGELHNSSASNAEYMKPIWNKLASLHLNAVIGTASWELVEPKEGQFDFALVDAQIQEAHRRNMRLVLIWFGSWKNATSTYVPMWVKTNQKRFPRIVTKPRTDLKSPFANFGELFQDSANITPLGEQSLAADAKAFRALMRHIKETDAAHTVIMMQVENETGLLLDSRDRSALAEAAWSAQVPAELMKYLQSHKQDLLPEMQEVWGRNGYKTSGTWAEVFGTDNHADEVFMAWYVGRYVGKVAEAGKAELNIPMYANAWLGPQPNMPEPGQYPSGGPVARVIDIWRAAAPSLDLFAPDIYVPDFKGTCALYARSGNPLFIPEARNVVGDLFWALGQHAALGFSPFGIEDVAETSQLAQAYQVLGTMLPVVARAQAEGKLIGVLLDGDQAQAATLAGYKLKVTANRWPPAPPEPAGAVDKTAGVVGPGFAPPPEKRPYGLVVSTGPDEFLLVGSGFSVRFLPDSAGPVRSEIGELEEGLFRDGKWVAGRRMNGDEGRAAIGPGRVGLLKVKLYRLD